MPTFSIRTDLALEARELNRGNSEELEGVSYKKTEIENCIIHNMEVINKEGEKAIGKPIGKYCTIELSGITDRQSENFEAAAKVLADCISEQLGELSRIESVLVAGLGNRDITPDALGSIAAENVLVTKHLKEYMSEDFEEFAPVCVIRPGVLGTSGIESGEFIKAICDRIKPSRVIIIDALAARELNRLCRTIQISNTGIVPGSGVGNSREKISNETIGSPVVAIGVPTVVDIGTVLADCKASIEYAAEEGMFVTPRGIDSEIRAAGKLIGYAINLALHRSISIEDVDLLLG